MDRDAKERIAEQINPRRGIKKEMTRELRQAYNNQNYNPSSKQVGAMRDYYADDPATREESVKLEAKGYNYVKTGDNKFKRVDKEEDTLYNPANNTLYLLDDDGKIKGKAKGF